MLATVSVLAIMFEILPVLVAAILSSIIFNYFFIPPVFDFQFKNSEDMLLCFSYYLIAFVNAVLTFRIKKYKNKIRDNEEKENTLKLYNSIFNSLSHELKTPISTILGAIDTLIENKEKLTVGNTNQLYTEINVASLRLNRQVENLLNMSRIENGFIQPQYDWLDIVDITKGVIYQLEEFASSHIIEFTPEKEEPLLKLDEGLLENILYNLLHNAIRYTPVNSIIKIDVKVDNLVLIIKISDNGNGFPKQYLEQVFNSFYRIPHSKVGGTGLGLSIVKGFTEALGGKIKLNNNINGGATFILEIPVEILNLNDLINE